ncbi:exopolysaccharide biosynthesis protein [Hirschia maritima]|uniref:exopolysaccharide biosynthesis protein n=1 Tax=Hirschia maritima TaxID=1121961 RepID=UPI000368E4C9|nr:exopolysaccharide biosynthesis protein [Hirschia maritima]
MNQIVSESPSKQAVDMKHSKPSLIESIEDLAENAPEEGITLKELTHALEGQAFGAALFILALPCCVPFLYLVPQIVALPMAAIAFQMVMGRKEPWLPTKFAERKISKEGLQNTAKGGRKYFGWVEKISRPRLTFFASSKLDRVIGLILVIFCLSILTPLPATNTIPGFAVAMVSFGRMERDGILTVGGLLLGIIWVSALITVATLIATGLVTGNLLDPGETLKVLLGR